MINEIKNARTTFGAFDATSYQKDKWLQYLLSELEEYKRNFKIVEMDKELYQELLIENNIAISTAIKEE